MRRTCTGLALVATVGVGGLQQPSYGATGYVVTLLPSLGGATVAYDISPSGRWVTGYSEQSSTSRAFRWSRATGSEWLALPAGTAHSDAFAVGDDGTVIGWASGCLPTCVSYAVRWRLGAPPEVLGSGAAHALSPDGAVVGGESVTATVWRSGAVEEKAEPGAVWDLADDGTAVGTARAADGTDRPALWPPGSRSAQLLPTGGVWGFASAVVGGTVAGWAGSRAAVWRDGRLTTLATPSPARNQPATSTARDLNASGVVVGDANGRAARWTSGAYVDLNTLLPRRSGAVLLRAHAVSTAGDVVGWARQGAFLLTRS